MPREEHKTLSENKIFLSGDGIHYEILDDAAKHFHAMGYRRLEVPWIIQTPVVAKVLENYPQKAHYTDDGYRMSASSEEGFIELMFAKGVPDGKFFTIAPCFRKEDTSQRFKTCWMQLGLFSVNLGDAYLKQMINDVKQISAKLGLHGLETVQNEAGDKFFLETPDGEEVASFGVREIDISDEKKVQWIFGAAINLPRFTQVMRKEFLEGVDA